MEKLDLSRYDGHERASDRGRRAAYKLGLDAPLILAELKAARAEIERLRGVIVSAYRAKKPEDGAAIIMHEALIIDMESKIGSQLATELEADNGKA